MSLVSPIVAFLPADKNVDAEVVYISVPAELKKGMLFSRRYSESRFFIVNCASDKVLNLVNRIRRKSIYFLFEKWETICADCR